MPFAARIACGQVTVSHLAHPRVALMPDYMMFSSKTIAVCMSHCREVFYSALIGLTDGNHLKLGHCEWRSTRRQSVRAVQGTANLFI